MLPRLLCSGLPWASRHCERPAEEDVEADENVFDHGEGDDGGDDGSTADDSTAEDDQDGRNSGSEDGAPSVAPSLPSQEARDPSDTELPLCQTSPNGEFFVSAESQAAMEAAEAADQQPGSSSGSSSGEAPAVLLVPYAYQVQGSIALNVEVLRTTVLPLLERQLADHFIAAWFGAAAGDDNNDGSCRLLPGQGQAVGTATASVRSSTSHTTTGTATSRPDPPHLRRQLQQSEANPAVDLVTGLQAAPEDILLPNYEGGTCLAISVLYCIPTISRSLTHPCARFGPFFCPSNSLNSPLSNPLGGRCRPLLYYGGGLYSFRSNGSRPQWSPTVRTTNDGVPHE
jgi:hypothetical protein